MEQNTITNNLNEDDYGICEECGNENTDEYWCLQCNSQRFQQNFGNWSSGNKDLDEIIQESQSNCTGAYSFVEWVPYSKFEDVKYIDKGGFGKIYSAIWKEGPINGWDIQQKQWERSNNEEVALKSLNNSQNITTEFLNEFKTYSKCGYSSIVPCLGITQDPETNNYMFVMQFMKGGNLRNFLKSNFFELSWLDKLKNLFSDETGISKNGKQKVFGVIPYIAPEVLSGDDYLKASDVYGFAMVMFEILTGIPPFYDIPHDKDLAFKICNGYRPEIPSHIAIPRLLVDIMKRCWDAKSEQRPTSKELFGDFYDFKTYIEDEVKESELYKQIEECNRLNLTNSVNNNNTNNLTSYETHPSAIYTSRCINFKNLPKPKNLNEKDDKNTNELTTKDYQITEEFVIEIP
ncbi:hypothetical protein Glove_79g88 [Diversispora epigaea]|uniref:Protein kinase domain-containing protein n=1 Tax=Diversispora epigaea TaxID=1348612 RepID=A0A397JHF0_9GLOM|nr:hypothetical protein Glove_79g88 [Diversispora epigaea]